MMSSAAMRRCVGAFALLLVTAIASGEDKKGDDSDALAFAPTGACCIQPGPNQPLVCIDGITHASCVSSQSIWQGNGSACGIASCAPLGACCFVMPGELGYQCTDTAEAICYSLPRPIYHGDNTTCGSATPCPTCILVPKTLSAWWTFDQIIGGVAYDATNAHHAGSLPTAVGGPQPFQTFNSLCLVFDGVNDCLYVPHSPDITIGVKDFTIDAWVYYMPSGTGHVLFNKSGSGLGPEGYYYGITVNGNPIFALYSGFAFPIGYTSTAFVPPNTWNHMAITGEVTGGQRTLRFYLNGVLTDTIPGVQTFIPDAPSFFNPATACIGSYQNSAYFWKGWIDEVELHMEALTDADIAAIHAVGTHGKCKSRVVGQLATPMCRSQSEVTVPVTLYNDSGTSKQFNVSFSPLNAGTVPGPTVFTPLFTNPVSVGPNSTTTVQVTIQRPVGMNAVYQSAFYLVTAAEIGGSTIHAHGTLVDRRDMCIIIDWCCLTEELVLDTGVPTSFHFVVVNSGPDPIDTPLYIQPIDPDDQGVSRYVSLNGLPPGTRYIGNLSIAPGAVQPVEVDITYVAHHPVGHDTLVISTDMDADDVPEPLRSVGLRSNPDLCEADIAPVDADGSSLVTRDGSVNIDDFTEIVLNWGTTDPNADIDDDGDVDIDDYTAVVLAWGPC